MVTKVNSYEEELLQLRQAARDLSAVSGDDVLLFDKVVASLWDRWLYLLGVFRDWELYCDELKQEWKLISELVTENIFLLCYFWLCLIISRIIYTVKFLFIQHLTIQKV